MCNWNYDLYKCGHKSQHTRVRTCQKPNACPDSYSVPKYLDSKCDKCRHSHSAKHSSRTEAEPSKKRKSSRSRLHQGHSPLAPKLHSGIGSNGSMFQNSFNLISSSNSNDFVPRSLCQTSISHKSLMAMITNYQPYRINAGGSSASMEPRSSLSGRHSPSIIKSQMPNYMYGDQTFVWHKANLQ